MLFSRPEAAYHLITRLDASFSFWLRLVYEYEFDIDFNSFRYHCSNTEDKAAFFMAHQFCRQKAYFYKVADVANDLRWKPERRHTLDNGDKYTFCHPSILAISRHLETVKIFDKAEAEKLLVKLMDAKNKKNAAVIADKSRVYFGLPPPQKNYTPYVTPYATLAKFLKINKQVTGDENSNKQIIVDALIAGRVIITLLKKPAAPPKPVEYLPLTAADKPPVIDHLMPLNKANTPVVKSPIDWTCKPPY